MNTKPLTLALVIVMYFATGDVASETLPMPTVYGKINLSYQAIEEQRDGDVQRDNWDMRSNLSRLGVKGSVPINENLKAIYKLEYEVIVDEAQGGSGGSDFKQRNTYGGLQGNWGTVIFGRNDTPTRMIQGKVDRFNGLYTGDINAVMAGEQRENEIVIYTAPKLADALLVNVAFMPGDDSGAPGDDENDGFADSISASVTYATDMLYLALSTDLDLDNTDLVRFVGEFIGGDFRVGGIIQMAEEADDGGMNGLSGLADYATSEISDGGLGLLIEEQDAYLLSGQYTINQWVLKAQYGLSENTLTGVSDDLELTQIALGADYKFNKASKLFAYYALVEGELDGLDNTENETFGVGYELKF